MKYFNLRLVSDGLALVFGPYAESAVVSKAKELVLDAAQKWGIRPGSFRIVTELAYKVE